MLPSAVRCAEAGPDSGHICTDCAPQPRGFSWRDLGLPHNHHASFWMVWEFTTARMRMNPALYYSWPWNDAVLSALLTDREYRGYTAETERILLGTCNDVILRRTADLLPKSELKWSDVSGGCRVSKNNASSSVLRDEMERSISFYASSVLDCERTMR